MRKHETNVKSMLDFLLEDLIWLAFELAALVLDLGSTKRDSKGGDLAVYRVVISSLVIVLGGVFFGLLSLGLFPRIWIRNSDYQLLYLIVSPILGGAISVVFGMLSQRQATLSKAARFWFGFAFVFALVLVRYLKAE
jgi:hypothetical protein